MIFESPEFDKGGLGAGTKTRSPVEIRERVRYCKFLIKTPPMDFRPFRCANLVFLIKTPLFLLGTPVIGDGEYYVSFMIQF